MIIRFLKQWGVYPKGRVTDALGAGASEQLVRRGFAEVVAGEPSLEPANKKLKPIKTRVKGAA